MAEFPGIQKGFWPPARQEYSYFPSEILHIMGDVNWARAYNDNDFDIIMSFRTGAFTIGGTHLTDPQNPDKK